MKNHDYYRLLIMTHASFRQLFYQRLSPFYLQGELQALYHWCVKEIEGWSRVEAYHHNDDEVTADGLNRWNDVVIRLQEKEPVQYIFNKAAFFDLELYVDKNVLIPRPETEELVQLVLDRESAIDLSVLDIGTGSGCIPLALKAARPYWKLSGCDISDSALEVAEQNAAQLKLPISFFQCDVSKELRLPERVDVIVSNPPYIPVDKASTMDDSVLKFEPKLALFAPDEDAYFYFKCIVQRAVETDVRRVYFETHATEMEDLTQQLKQLSPWEVEVVNDLSGKERFILLSR